MGRSLGAQREDPVSLGRYRQGLTNLARYLDCIVRAGRNALATTDAGLVNDPDRFTIDRYRRRGTRANAR